MQLDTIEIDQEEATARLAEYEESLRHDRIAEDEQIAAGYRAAARGLPIIRLSQTVHAGGYFDDSGLPRIAVVRADAQRCWVYSGHASGRRMDLVFSGDPDVRNRGALVGRDSVRVTVPGRDRTRYSSWVRASTIAPNIPPHHRPPWRRMHRWHVLWEVESWTPEPPRDPALLKHIGGDLWAVHAVWDLTDLERAVLTGRA